MADIQATQRQLKIKAGAALRLFKEHNLYIKETEDQQRKLDKLLADGISSDEWDVKNAKRMLEEGHRMIQDSAKRTSDAAGALGDLITAVKTKPEFADNIELLNAESIFKQVFV